MALSSKTFTPKEKTVSMSKRLAEANIQKFLEDKDGNPVKNPAFELVEKTKAKAEEVFKALGSKYNVRYDVREYTNKDGEKAVACTVDLSGYDKNKDNKTPQNISLKLKTEDMSISYVDVTTFDANSNKVSKVPYKEQYESVKSIRATLESAGLVKAFEPKQGEVEHTPEGDIRAAVYEAVDKVNKNYPKTTNKEGKEVGKYYLSSLKDTSFEAKDGTTVPQQSFDIKGHDCDQQITVNIREGVVVGLKISDFEKYDADKKNYDAIQSVNVFKMDYLDNEKLDALDKGLKDIAKQSITIEHSEKTQDAPEIDDSECPWNDVADDFADER